jgi:hypothetical protein
MLLTDLFKESHSAGGLVGVVGDEGGFVYTLVCAAVRDVGVVESEREW